MKHKRITQLSLFIILASQFSTSIVTCAATDVNSFEEVEMSLVKEDTIQSNMTDREEIGAINKSSISDEDFFIGEIASHEDNIVAIEDLTQESLEEKVGPKTLSETRNQYDITFTTSKVTFPLGSAQYGSGGVYDRFGLDPYFKKNTVAKRDGRILSSSEYIVWYLAEPDTDKLTYRNESFFVTLSQPFIGGSSGGESVDYAVDYGQSIVFSSDVSKSSGAFTYHYIIEDKNKSMLTASNADGNRKDMINTSYKNQDYYTIEVFKPKKGSLLIEEDTELVTELTAQGHQTKEDVFKQWENKKSKVSVDNIIRTWSIKPEYNNFYKGSTKYNYVKNDGYAYYKVTEDGLEPILSTPLQVVPQKIKTNTTDQEIEDMFDDFFEDKPDYITLEKFIEYPDRSKEGKTTAKVQIAETSEYTNNEKVTEVYTIPFEVEAVKLEVDLKDADVLLGANANDIDVSDFIETVYYEGEELGEDDYSASFIVEPDTMVFGESDDVWIEIVLNEDNSVSLLVQARVNVMWGNTIVSRTEASANSEMMTSISLLEENKKPQLKMTYGTGNDNRVRSGNELQIYRNNHTNILFSEKENPESYTYQSQTIKSWQPKLDKIDLDYGDVLKQTVYDRREDAMKGTHTYVSRNESLVKETEGYESAFYELTREGYHLLQLNQLTVSKDVLTFEYGASREEVNEQAVSLIKVPSHIKDVEKFRYELDVDTTKLGKNKGKINIYEKLGTKEAGEFMISKDIDYIVEQNVVVKLKENAIPVGTPKENIIVTDYIESVTKGGQELDSKDYTVTVDNALNTNLVGSQDTVIKVKVGDNEVTSKTKTNIMWGNSIITKVDDKADAKIDASVSMIDKNGKPYLVANEGIGFASGNLYNRPYIAVLRSSTEEVVFEAGYHSTNSPARDTMTKWNNGDDKTVALSSKEYQYGDVFRYRVNKNSPSDKSEMGNKTWVSRDEKLIKETVGYDTAYYEMTEAGFRLMQFNQLEVNPEIPVVSMYTSLEEMNKNAKDTMLIPEHIENPENYRFEYVSVNTESSGVKQTKMNVYEKLSTGKEFKTTYDVSYQVNPQVKESFYDIKGNKLTFSRITDFDLGGSYQPIPENYISVGDDVYIYKGWLDGGKRPGVDTPKEGKPGLATKETVINYIYEKADNYINMTIPTELLFGTEENSNKISSKNYEIRNNSEKVSTDVSLSEFRKEKADIKLLNTNEVDPIKQEKSARLNLTSNNDEVIKSLTEEMRNEHITTLYPGESTAIGLSGTYFGNLDDSNIVHYQMSFTFKVNPK